MDDPSTVQGKVFQALDQLEHIRKREKVFMSTAAAWTVETWAHGVLCICRAFEEDKLVGLFNFSEEDRTARIHETGEYVDLISGQEMGALEVDIPGYGFYYLKKKG